MKVVERAYAKINLFLDVRERREDGFHNIVSVMQSVSLYDTITLRAKESDRINIGLTCDDPSLPLDENNLIYKSASKYLSFYGIKADIEISVHKEIPVGAGLGGGSSDAAATLRALDKIFCVANENELLYLATQIGSDVPFCLIGGRALCTGRGEKIELINDIPLNHVVVAIGQGRVSTPMAYAELDIKYNNFISDSYSPVEYKGQYYNIFESVTDAADILNIKDIMTKNGAEFTLMSGSGPSVFGVFELESKAKAACDALAEKGFSAYYCQTIKGEI